MVQGHFLAQRLLIKVLAQVWEKGGSRGSQVELGPEVPAPVTRWQCTPRECSWGNPGLYLGNCLVSKVGASPGGVGEQGSLPDSGGPKRTVAQEGEEAVSFLIQMWVQRGRWKSWG